MEKFSSTEAAGHRIDGAQDAKKEIPAEVLPQLFHQPASHSKR
jgi:hypothetical protein